MIVTVARATIVRTVISQKQSLLLTFELFLRHTGMFDVPDVQCRGLLGESDFSILIRT